MPKLASLHPLCPLTADEIARSAELIRALWPTNIDLRFKLITLKEPAKKDLGPFLLAEHNGTAALQIDRKSFVSYYIRNTVSPDRLDSERKYLTNPKSQFHEAIINLTIDKVQSNVRLGPNHHGGADFEEATLIEKTALQDESVLRELAKLNLPEGTVICGDPWSYGSDGVDDNERLCQVFLYSCDPANPKQEDSNYYAFPLPISPVLECNHYKVIRIDVLPTGSDGNIKPFSKYMNALPNEYLLESQKIRQDVKPLHIIQPEGAGFQITPLGETGHRLSWQKWSFILGFNLREGMVLYDIHYDSRPLFYRVSLSDMNIPYADPRPPFHRKSAFDLGDVGAGGTANNLKLGCDCLGHITYISCILNDDKGLPVRLENVVCVHEQDAGIGWKHTNYRTNRAAIVRSRELILQSIITVSNYEYILAFQFNQAGELSYEVRATGVLSTQPIDHDLNSIGVPFGTVVHPGVLATHHQHIFSLRLDPMIDGPSNELVFSEAYTMPIDQHMNPHGTGYIVTDTAVVESGGYDLNIATNRSFKIQNPNVRNPVNNKPVAYKIQTPPFQKILAHPSSFNFRRAQFSDHNIYVTTHNDRELYSGGWYTNQSRGTDGVRTWAGRKEALTPDSDIVVWVQFGINHIPRVEDFPVMPCEAMKVSLKPVNFFSKNPALDVPPSEQHTNRSTLASI